MLRAWTPAESDDLGSDRAPVAAPLTMLVLSALLVLMQLYVAIPLAPVLGAEFGGDGAPALGTAYGLAYAAGFLVFGPLTDRYGRKVVLVLGMVGLTAATAAVAAAESMAVVGVLRAVQGFAASSFPAAALAYVGEALPPRWRSTGIGAVSTAFLVAGILGQVYAQAVTIAVGWRWAFVIAAPAFAVAALGLAGVLGEPARAGVGVSLGARFRQLGGLVARRELLLPYLAFCTVLLSFVAMYAALGPVLKARFDLDDSDVLLMRLAALPAMLLAPMAGWLVGRLGAQRVCVAGFLLAACGLALEAASAGHLWALVLASTVFVAGIATIVPSAITMVGARAGPNRAAALALAGLALFVGASAGSLASRLGLSFPGLLLALAALLVVGAALTAVSEPRHPTG